MANPDPGQTIDLRALRDTAAAQLNTRLLAGDASLAELHELRERLGLLDDALARPARPDQHHSGAQMWPLAWPVALVAAVLLLAATVPVPTVPFSLEVHASSVKLVLPSATMLGAQPIAGGGRLAREVEKPGDSQRADLAARADIAGWCAIHGTGPRRHNVAGG
jgi:hypothetical protein